MLVMMNGIRWSMYGIIRSDAPRLSSPRASSAVVAKWYFPWAAAIQISRTRWLTWKMRYAQHVHLVPQTRTEWNLILSRSCYGVLGVKAASTRHVPRNTTTPLGHRLTLLR